MKTVVDVIRECLDKGITNEYDIAIELKETFPNGDIYKMQKRIKSTIIYINSKRVIKSEFDIKGAPIKMEHQDTLIKILRIVKEKTDMKIPKFIWGTGRLCYYRRPRNFYSPDNYIGNFIRVTSNSRNIYENNYNNFLGVILHELIHANGFGSHDEAFFNKLTEVGLKCGLNLTKWFDREYPNGKKLYINKIKPKIDKEVLNEWEKI